MLSYIKLENKNISFNVGFLKDKCFFYPSSFFALPINEVMLKLEL